MSLTNVQQLEVEKEVKKAKAEMDASLIAYDKMVELTGYKKELISIMHRTVAKGTNMHEFAYFLTFCKGVGLNPLNKEIWCYKDNRDNVIIFTGRDGFLKKNKENPMYRGMRSSEVMEFDEFEIDMIEGKVSHKITTNRGNKILGAYAIISIEGQRDTIIWLDFDEFNLGQAKWKSSPKMMIKKCAQSAALKESAGIAGLQSEESVTIKNDVAYFKEPEVADKREEERLLLMIENSKNILSLEKLLKECKTAEEIDAYDKKMEDLKNIKV